MGKYAVKKGGKNQYRELEIVPQATQQEEVALPASRKSDDAPLKKEKWINRQRVLVLCGRGISHRDRHLMKDLKTLMPHHRAEPKLERWKTLAVINEIAEMKHCNKTLYLEGRHKQDLFMWLSANPNGPSAKFQVENVNTMGELKLTGNCLKGARPLLSFDQNFTEQPPLMLMRELLTQIFGVPNHHPKSQPFVDRVYSFTFVDNRIWFRNYQILSEDGALAEVGPRFVLNPIKIFAESFTGEPIWENEKYVTPASHRRTLREDAKHKYINRTDAKVRYESTQSKNPFDMDKFGREVFQNKDETEVAEKLVEQENSDDDDDESMDDEPNNGEATEKDIERVKKLIEKLKPGREAKSLVKKKKVTLPGEKKIVKAKNKKAKMIQNIAKTKKLSNKVKP